MAVNNIWKLHSLQFNDDTTPTPLVIGSMNSVNMPTDREIVREVNAGKVYASHAHVNFRSAQINLTTWNAGVLLNKIGPIGLCINTTDPQVGVSVFVGQYDCNQLVSPASEVHTEYRIRRGVIFPTTISVDHQQNVQVGVTIVGVWDGVSSPFNEPVEKIKNVALPTIGTTPHDESARWTMDKTRVNALDLFQKQTIAIDMGAQANTLGADSEQFDTWVSLDQVLPIIRYQGINPDWYQKLQSGPSPPATPAGPVTSIAGERVVHADTDMYFKKREVAIGVAEHIFLQMAGIASMNDPFAMTGIEAGRTDMQIDAVEDGVNAPIVWNADVVIP